jgi:hypothetical protein
MEIYSILKKVEQKLASSSELDLATQKFDSEMGDLALTCFKNKNKINATNNSEKNKLANIDLSSIKEKILSSVSSANNTLQNTAGVKTLGLGLGGMGIGALLGSHLTPDKSENETDEQYKKRKRESSITGGIAGTALGISAPSVLNSIKSFADTAESTSGSSKITDAINSMINPTTVIGGTGVAAGAVGNAFLNKLKGEEIAALTSKLTGNAQTDLPFTEAIAKLKGQIPLISKLPEGGISLRGEMPWKPGMGLRLALSENPSFIQKLMWKPKVQSLIAKANPLLAGSSKILNPLLKQTTRGKLLPIVGGLAALLGKNYLDTTAFNNPAFE